MTGRHKPMGLLLKTMGLALAVTMAGSGLAFAKEGAGADGLLFEAQSLARLIKRLDRQGPRPPMARFETASPPYRNRIPYAKFIRRASRGYGIPEPLIAAVIKCESNWNHLARSRANAQGLMQVLPLTARGTFGVPPENLWDPATNIHVGTAYLRLLANRYNGNTTKVLAAYNAGPTRVDARRTLPRETRGYIHCVRRWHPVYERSLK